MAIPNRVRERMITGLKPWASSTSADLELGALAVRARVYSLTILLLLAACSKTSPAAQDAGATQVDEAPPPTQEQLKLARLKEAIALPEMSAVFSAIKPELKDSHDSESLGLTAFQMWSAANMRWSDVYVDKNETSYALFQKDSDEGRGKRLCLSGQLIQIAKDSNAKGFRGLISTGSGNLYNFFAVGSTGDLVSQSWGRFCGVALEKFDYSNSGGGTGHAISVVGMFDLPANKNDSRPVSANSLPTSR